MTLSLTEIRWLPARNPNYEPRQQKAGIRSAGAEARWSGVRAPRLVGERTHNAGSIGVL